jgi:hypothetical protein
MQNAPGEIERCFELHRERAAFPTVRTTATSGPLALRYGPLGSELRTVVTKKV